MSSLETANSVASPASSATEAARGSKRTRQDSDTESPATGMKEQLHVVKERGSSKKRRKVAQDRPPPTSTSTSRQGRPRKKLSPTAPGFEAAQQVPSAAPLSAQRAASTSVAAVNPLTRQDRSVRRGPIALPQVPPIPPPTDAASPALPTITITEEPSASTRQQSHRTTPRNTYEAREVAGSPQSSRTPQPPYQSRPAAHSETATQPAPPPSWVPYVPSWMYQSADRVSHFQWVLRGVADVLPAYYANLRERGSVSGSPSLSAMVYDRLPRAPESSAAQAPFNVGPVGPQSNGASSGAALSERGDDEKLELTWSRSYSAEYRTIERTPSSSGRSSFSSVSSPSTPSDSNSRGVSSGLGAAGPTTPSFEKPSWTTTDTSLPQAVGWQFQPGPAQQIPLQDAVGHSPSPARSPSVSSTTQTVSQPAKPRISDPHPATSPGNGTNGRGPRSTAELPQEGPFIAPLSPSMETGRDAMVGSLQPWCITEDAHPSVLQVANGATTAAAEAPPQSLYGELPPDMFYAPSDSMAAFGESPLENAEWMLSNRGDGGDFGAGFGYDLSSEPGFIYRSLPYDNYSVAERSLEGYHSHI
ncbi:hypothetical protein C8Q73DRAFT_783764, partial [Cubamyces lactineus]